MAAAVAVGGWHGHRFPTGCLGYDDARAWAADIIDRLWDAGGARIVVLQPETQPGHNSAHFTTKAGNHVIMVQEEIKDPSNTGLALARGLGLSAGLCDPTTAGCIYPRAGGALGPYTGLRYWPDLATVPGEEPLGTSVAHDLMQPGGNPAWISPYNYCRAIAGLWSGRLACPGSLDHALLTP